MNVTNSSGWLVNSLPRGLDRLATPASRNAAHLVAFPTLDRFFGPQIYLYYIIRKTMPIFKTERMHLIGGKQEGKKENPDPTI